MSETVAFILPLFKLSLCIAFRNFYYMYYYYVWWYRASKVLSVLPGPGYVFLSSYRQIFSCITFSNHFPSISLFLPFWDFYTDWSLLPLLVSLNYINLFKFVFFLADQLGFFFHYHVSYPWSVSCNLYSVLDFLQCIFNFTYWIIMLWFAVFYIFLFVDSFSCPTYCYDNSWLPSSFILTSSSS